MLTILRRDYYNFFFRFKRSVHKAWKKIKQVIAPLIKFKLYKQLYWVSGAQNLMSWLWTQGKALIKKLWDFSNEGN